MTRNRGHVGDGLDVQISSEHEIEQRALLAGAKNLPIDLLGDQHPGRGLMGIPVARRTISQPPVITMMNGRIWPECCGETGGQVGWEPAGDE